MTHDPEAWKALGRAIRSDRERQGLTRADLAARVSERGGSVTPRSIGSLETGVVPKKRTKPPTLEPVVAALGWRSGWTDRILAGESASAVLEVVDPEAADASPRGRLLELLPEVYEFSRTAVELGVDTSVRDRFDRLAHEIMEMVRAGTRAPTNYALAAYRPHAEGEGVPADDVARIVEAMRNAG